MRKVLKFIFLFLLISINIFSVNAEEFNITADNVILYNLNDNDILYELESEEKVSVASLTKIMTTIVAIENIKDLNEEVVVTNEVFRGIEDYSKMGLKVGNRVTYKDLLYGIMLPSGADAVNAMAINLTGSVDNFVKLMNDKVKELNLENTKFDNPIGMDSDNNYSTAKDISEILLYSMKNDTFKEIFYTKEYTITNLNLKIKSTLLGYSRNLGVDLDNILGAKSGFTDGAGLCFATIANYDDVEYLLVVLGSDTENRGNAVKDSLEIYNHYSSNYSYQQIVTKDQVVKKLNVKFGHDKIYELKSNKEIYLYLPNSVRKNRIKYIYEGIEELNYSIKKGDKLGTVKVIYEDEELTRFDIYLNDELEYYHPVLYIVIFISFIVMISSLKKIIFKKKNKKKRRKRKRR